MFVLIESADIEITRIRLYSNREAVQQAFNSICETEKLIESNWRPDFEIGGTIAIAGDDSCCVQIIERGVEQ